MRTPFLTTILLALGGCVAPYTEPSLSHNHPASLDAEEASLPPRSRTLELSVSEPVTPAQAGSEPPHAGHADEGRVVVYVCPMHPEVTSDKPDQRCPACGMKLEAATGPGGRE